MRTSVQLLERYKKKLGVQGTPKLIRETRWLRVYEVGANQFLYESKFSSDSLELRSSEFKKLWPTLGQRERQEFCVAYVAKPRLSRQDAEILNFLMKANDSTVWRSIVSMLPRHTDKKRVLDFLTKRIRDESEPLANYYHALERLRYRKAIPILRKCYGQYVTYFKSNPNAPRESTISYLHCCRALLKLTKRRIYKMAIERLSESDDEYIRNCAKESLQ